MSTLQATNLKHGSSASNNIVLDASGNTTISGNAVVGGALQANGVTGNVYPLVSGTAQASTSGTSIDFTGIPSWVKRVTVMFSGVSTNGTSNLLVQLGAGSITTSGYNSNGTLYGGTNTTTGGNSTAGFFILNNSAAFLFRGWGAVCLFSGNTWVWSGNFSTSAANYLSASAGDIALGGVLDRVRITTVGGTDTFDAGSINILYEG